jgi:cysteinyl-tRNA synthetase
MQAKYRTKLNFSTEGLAGADRALRQLRERLAEWSRDGSSVDTRDGDEWEARFRSAIADDLDLPAVMAIVAELTRADLPPQLKAKLLTSWDRVLGLDLDRSIPTQSLPGGASQLLDARETARAAKDFATSDRLRDELARAGVSVKDTPDGQKWKVSR